MKMPPRKCASPFAVPHTSGVAIIPYTSTFEINVSIAYEITPQH